MQRFIIGCGYLGRKVAQAQRVAGIECTGLVRSSESLTVLEKAGIKGLQVDLDAVDLPSMPLENADIFYFAPPPSRGVEDSRILHLIEAFEGQGSPRRIVYLSTTGVYGDCQGEWVDETRPIRPVVDRALRRADAERRLQQWCRGQATELVILRVAGIYGPGKLPLARLKKGLPVVREEEAPYSNRIHIDDLVRVCIAAMEHGREGEIYNVSDGQSGNMTDYFNRIADLAGLPRPEQISMDEGEQLLSPGMMSYMGESRRLDNRKMLRDLGVDLDYPTLEKGLASIDFRG